MIRHVGSKVKMPAVSFRWAGGMVRQLSPASTDSAVLYYSSQSLVLSSRCWSVSYALLVLIIYGQGRKVQWRITGCYFSGSEHQQLNALKRSGTSFVELLQFYNG